MFYKKSEVKPFTATWMCLGIVILSEVNQTEKDKYHMISLICRIFKNDSNELIYKQNRNRLIDLEKKLRLGGERGGIN